MEISLPELWQMEMDQLKLETEKEPDDVIWRFSPLDINEFDIMLHIAYDLATKPFIAVRTGQISMVEAGSGIGTKLYLAKHKYRLTEYGYEINAEYVDKSRKLGVQAELRDLTMEPTPIWSAYDIVYTCRPLKDDIAEVKLEKSIQDGMRPGAVLIAAFVASKPHDWPIYYRRPFRGIWVKPDPDDHRTRAEARAAVVRRAQSIYAGSSA
jgi:uncharacterized UPF0146 family protein